MAHESLRESVKTASTGLTRTANDGSPGAGCGAPAGLSVATASWYAPVSNDMVPGAWPPPGRWDKERMGAARGGGV